MEFQIIKVLDEDGPIVYCPTTPKFRDTIGVDLWKCVGETDLPIPHILPPGGPIVDSGAVYIIAECSDVTYTVKHLAATDPDNCNPGPGPATSDHVRYDPVRKVWVAFDLPLGCNWFYYTFEDECGNVTECQFDIVVIDDAPPSAVCDEHTIVSLGIDGRAKAYAITFDDGSWDNCEIDTMAVRRMDRGGRCYNDYQWRKYVEFCCADIGNTVMVEFAVWDKAGNSSICMVEAEVQDKIAPTIQCPPNITISCQANIEDLSIFGKVVNTSKGEVREKIEIDDPYFEIDGDGLDGVYYDNCGATIKVVESDNIDCGNGTIRRTFTATDDAGRSAVCTQIITVIDFERFEMRSSDWPRHREITTLCVDSLAIDTSITGAPRLRGGHCGKIFVNFEDQTFTIEPDACLKVLRHWTVIDWCYYDPNHPDPDGIWTWTQVIKVLNNVAPTITSGCTHKQYDLWGECTEDVNLKATATDDCTDEDDLRWSYWVDEYNNGDYDHHGKGNDVFVTLPPGTHKVKWTVWDQCNNSSECMTTFEVKDAKKPTPYCRNGIITVIMPSTEMIEIWASDYDIGSFDNCTERDDLIFRFLVNNQYVPNMKFDCSDIGIQTIKVYVFDEAGNFDFCESEIDIQDPNGVCPSNSNTTVGGQILTRMNIADQGANVSLSKLNNSSAKAATTNASGNYTFNNIVMGSSYHVRPERNDDPMNGISTKDLVLIQAHLLGKRPFNSPYEYIAADVNNNQGVAASDITELRRLILGKYVDFRNDQQSWRFVASHYQFSDWQSPFPFQEQISIYDLNKSSMENDFVSIKIGDLDATATTGLKGNGTRGNDGELVLSVDDYAFAANEEIRVPVTARGMDAILGLQFTLNFNAQALELINVESGALTMTKESYHVNEGQMTLSWFDIDQMELEEDVIFTLVFNARATGSIAGSLEISSDLTLAEAFSELDDSYNVRLNVNGSDDVTVFELDQNIPNPFSSTTIIGFNLPQDEDVSLTVFDLTGRVHKVVSGHFEKGRHQLELNGNELLFEGVLYYQLTAGSYTATRKMLLLK